MTTYSPLEHRENFATANIADCGFWMKDEDRIDRLLNPKFDKIYGPMARDSLRKYSSNMHPKLRALMEGFADNTQIFNISEEIALAQVLHSQNVDQYNAVFSLFIEDVFPDKKVGEQALALAAEVMNASNENVTRLIERYAKIVALTAGKIHPQAMDSMCKHICKIVYRIFDQGKPENQELIDKFNEELSRELDLSSLAALGTTYTPDQQVTAMDSAVPFVAMESTAQ